MKLDLNLLDITLTKALEQACENDIIILKSNYTYFEKIVLDKPNITLIGDNSIVEFNACHSDLNENGVKYGTTGSSTFRVLKNGHGFKAINVTFINSHKRSKDAQNQAVAFKSECDNVILENSKFISCQDTLYFDEGKNVVVNNCYITGDVDFIFGSADATFTNCIIEACNHSVAYYTAPSTYESNKQGFLFDNCTFLSKCANTYLGRWWYPGGAKELVMPKITFNNCKFQKDIKMEMLQMHDKDPNRGKLEIK